MLATAVVFAGWYFLGGRAVHSNVPDAAPGNPLEITTAATFAVVTAGADGRVRHASAATISATPATTLPKISKVALRPRGVVSTPAMIAGTEIDA